MDTVQKLWELFAFFNPSFTWKPLAKLVLVVWRCKPVLTFTPFIRLWKAWLLWLWEHFHIPFCSCSSSKCNNSNSSGIVPVDCLFRLHQHVKQLTWPPMNAKTRIHSFVLWSGGTFVILAFLQMGLGWANMTYLLTHSHLFQLQRESDIITDIYEVSLNIFMNYSVV